MSAASFSLLTLVCVCLSILALRAASPSAICENPATGLAQPGTFARTLVSGGRERCYLLHVPPGYDPAEPMPVVFGLHGFASSARGQERVSGWNQIADAEGLIVVYPEGASFPLRWNAADAFFCRTVDDVRFFQDVVADVTEIVSIDPARIYVSGISNGGAMANRVACEAADTVAAIGTVAAVPIESAGGCRPSRPVPVIAFHGTADPLVSYGGGRYEIPVLSKLVNLSTEPIEYRSVEASIAAWAARNGCSMSPDAIPATGDASSIRYSDCRDNAEVILYTISGGGHTWPGSFPIPFLGKTSTDVDASATMWEFFAAHPMSR